MTKKQDEIDAIKDGVYDAFSDSLRLIDYLAQ